MTPQGKPLAPVFSEVKKPLRPAAPKTPRLLAAVLPPPADSAAAAALHRALSTYDILIPLPPVGGGDSVAAALHAANQQLGTSGFRSAASPAAPQTPAMACSQAAAAFVLRDSSGGSSTGGAIVLPASFGPEEARQALLTAGASERTMTPAWIANHWRWAVWKLAAAERAAAAAAAAAIGGAPQPQLQPQQRLSRDSILAELAHR